MSWWPFGKGRDVSAEERIALEIARQRPADDAPARTQVFFYLLTAASKTERERREGFVATMFPMTRGVEAPAAPPPQRHALPVDDEADRAEAAYAQFARNYAAGRAATGAAPGDLFDVAPEAMRRDNETEARYEQDAEERAARARREQSA